MHERYETDPEALAKAKYFSDFALRHFQEMKILKKGGVLGKENRDWRNDSAHCLTAAAGADVLAEALGLAPEKRAAIVRATLLHDWYKKHEVAASKAYGGGEGHRLASEENEMPLREFGVPEEIICLAHANIPESSDPTSLARRPLEEKIMHCIDMITSESNFFPYPGTS